MGDERCRFCEAKESVDHLFIHCSLAKYVWGAVSCALGVSMNLDTAQDISLWIMRFPGKTRGLMAAGVAAVIRGLGQFGR